MDLFNFFKKERSSQKETSTQRDTSTQKELSHAEKVNAVYNNCEPKLRKELFPAGIQQMNGIICSLAYICGYDLNKADIADYNRIVDLYVSGFGERFPPPHNSLFLNALQPSENGLIKSPETAQAVRSYIKLTLLEGTFALESKEDVNIFQRQVEIDSETLSPTQKSPSVGFYFENISELITYGILYGNGRVVSALSGNNYLDQYQKGYQLAERGLYKEAIDALQECLKLNPIGISARFEIFECYIQLGDILSARSVLLELFPYLTEAKHIAKFYRRLGYLAVEAKSYLLGAACYQWSRKFEAHPSIEQELQYISDLRGVDIQIARDCTAAILRKYNVPFLRSIQQQTEGLNNEA